MILSRRDYPGADTPIPPALAARLREAFAWPIAPETLAEVAHGLRAEARYGAGLVVASCAAPSLTAPDGPPAHHTPGALDALLLPRLTGEPVKVRSACPHCGAIVTVDVEGGCYSAARPGVVLSFGVARVGKGSIRDLACPFIHLFPDRTHYAAWAAGTTEALTMELPLAAAAVFSRALASHALRRATEGCCGDGDGDGDRQWNNRQGDKTI